MVKQAMIFAAGLGKRMLPITKSIPKPLVKINKDSLLVNNIRKLVKNNYNPIIINTFHFPEKIIQEVQEFKNEVTIVIEKVRLETGGGLLNCLKKKYLDWEYPTLLLNSDVYWVDKKNNTIDSLLESWDQERMDLILCMKKKKEFFGYEGSGDFNLEKNVQKSERLIFSKSPNLVFTGLQIINPKILINKKEKVFSLKETILQSVENQRAHGFIDKNIWFHIGTVKSLNGARKFIS